jgi:hypothetical protein
MPEAHAHRFHDIVSVVTGVPIEEHYGENRLK